MTNDEDMERAVERLQAGQLVAVPTETVYGLAADATSDAAVARIFEAKERPAFNPLIVHVSGAHMAKRYVQWNDVAEKLSRTFWPGALTLVLPRLVNSPISLLASAGGDTLAIRMPNHPLTQTVIAGLDRGIAAPSANKSGKISPTRAYHVQQEFIDDDVMILDGGKCGIGIESTVVDCTGEVATILRPGAVTGAMMREAGVAVDGFRPERGIRNPKSPGMLSSHYAPSIPVRINATVLHPGEALLAFGADPIEGAERVLNLSESGNLLEAAANLFSHMRSLDTPNHKAIAVMLVPMDGIGAAINDRLRRAAV